MDISTLYMGGEGSKAWEEGAKFAIKIWNKIIAQIKSQQSKILEI